MHEVHHTGSPFSADRELESLQEIWVFLLIAGISLTILGFVAISFAFFTTLATVLVYGILLLVGAGFQVVIAFWSRRWRGFFLHLLTGMLYLIVGVFMLERPLQAAVALTLLLAVVLLVGGLV